MKSSAELAIEAFNMRPTRAEALRDLSEYCRIKGWNAAALLFAYRGIELKKPNDLLFVEDAPYEWGFKQDISICAYYLDRERATGHAHCEELATSRDVPAEVREEAWNNLFFYTRPLAEQAPSFQTERLRFVPPDGFRPMNPSIARLGDQMYLNIRCVDYLIGQDGRYQFANSGEEATTRNFLFSVPRDIAHLPLYQLLSELTLPKDFPCIYRGVMGVEDVRLFPREGGLWFSATSRQHSPDGRLEIIVGRIWQGRISDWHAIKSPNDRYAEKNWTPVIGQQGTYSWIYLVDPLTVIGMDGEALDFGPAPAFLEHCGGSTQAIPFDGGYLTMVHERQAKLDPMHGQRNYQQRFIWFDGDLKIRKISRRFILGSGQGEFPCGMCEHPDGERLVFTYGILDREAWIATVRINEVRGLLREVGEPEIMRARPDDTPKPEAPPEMIVLDEKTDRRGRRIRSVMLANSPKPFELDYNRPLRTRNEILTARACIESKGWAIHPDFTKNWDLLLAVQATLDHTGPHDPILDAGADRVSPYLPILAQLGYEHLDGNNLLEPGIEMVGPIRYRHENIEDTRFPRDIFAFIACLSVIEHGVNIERFLHEQARVLRHGGHLFISTDYWPDPIDTRIEGWRILTPADIADLVCIAQECGLTLTTPLSLNAQDRVCHHAGLDYTFINLLFQKA